ncbi:MAG: hypothetical protein JHD16_00645 [Solirubrobacteraceae bacterium]|nr:hypothetical protein [Solirubrobacteraceae bacterium]
MRYTHPPDAAARTTVVTLDDRADVDDIGTGSLTAFFWDEAGDDEVSRALRYGAVGGSRDLA